MRCLVARSAGWESTLDPEPGRWAQPLLGLDAQAERSALPDPASRDIGPVVASRNELFLASISAGAVVAGQTQKHVFSLESEGAVRVPPTVPQACIQRQLREQRCPGSLKATPRPGQLRPYPSLTCERDALHRLHANARLRVAADVVSQSQNTPRRGYTTNCRRGRTRT